MDFLDHSKDDSTEGIFLQDNHRPTIAEHAAQCKCLFHRYMAVPEIVPDPTILDDQLARLKLWASNMDVDGPLNASLDYRLLFSPTLVEIIHQFLGVICDTLASLKPIEDRPRTPSRKRQCISKQRDSRRADDDASDSDSDMDSAEDNISKITDIIGGTVTRLFHLSNAIRNSAKDHQARTFERDRDDEEASNAIAELRLDTECYVRFRFPRAPDSLRSALVEANAMRFRRLYYQRSRRCVQSQQTDPTTVRLPEIKESAALVNSKLSFPPMPLDHECPYCGVTVDFRGTAEPTLWHNHVIRDLEPFICVFAPCLEAAQHGTGPQTFATSKAWLSHMQHAHGHTWECRAPSHNPITFDQEIQYKEHAINEHGVPETHAGTLSGAARRPVVLDNKVLECPFGDGFQPSGEVEVELSPVFSSQALQSHVASHMK